MRIRRRMLSALAPVLALAVVARPAFGAPAPATRTFTTGPYRITVDPRPQVLSIDSPVPSGPERPLWSAPIVAGGQDFTSAAVLAQKGKLFDDGLYAAVELAAERGLGRFPGKAELLRSVCSALARLDTSQTGTAQEILFAAARLGQVDVAEPPAILGRVQSRIDTFLAAEVASKPIGFYTWSPELSAIFRQDRMLADTIRQLGSVRALAHALREDPGAARAYDASLALTSRLTNPLAWAGFGPALQGGEMPGKLSFLPPSRALETELLKRLLREGAESSDIHLMDELVQRVRDGRFSLALRRGSGWYDYQTWALEPLLRPEATPEAAKLRFGDEYRKSLVELFKGLLTMVRETHVKALESVREGDIITLDPPIIVRPDLHIEPLATHYLRRAEAYAFVRRVLVDAFGAGALTEMHRMTPTGPVARSLANELDHMQALYHGAYLTARRDIGMPDDRASSLGTAADADTLTQWTAELYLDKDLNFDSRCMVPLSTDITGRSKRVWVMLGWSTRPLSVSYAAPPAVTVRRIDGAPSRGRAPRIEFEAGIQRIFYPVMAELWVGRLLDREEFQRVCDQYKTREAILAALK